MPGKYTDHIRPIVIFMLTCGLLYGLYRKDITGDQYSLIFLAISNYLFNSNKKRE